MITFTDGSTTRYTYDATGRKLRTEHRVMTTGVFNPGLDDGGTAVPDTGGIALPFPDDPGLAVGEGGLGAWPEMSVFEEDEWEINKKGYIVNHIKTNEHDAFFVVNRKGKRIQDKSITFRFGTIEKATGIKPI